MADLDHLAGFDGLECGKGIGDMGSNVIEIVRSGANDQEGKFPPSHVLLVGNVFVDGDEYIELVFGEG